jgi:hypothetical protein
VCIFVEEEVNRIGVEFEREDFQERNIVGHKFFVVHIEWMANDRIYVVVT